MVGSSGSIHCAFLLYQPDELPLPSRPLPRPEPGHPDHWPLASLRHLRRTCVPNLPLPLSTSNETICVKSGQKQTTEEHLVSGVHIMGAFVSLGFYLSWLVWV